MSEKHCYSSACSWHGSISKVGTVSPENYKPVLVETSQGKIEILKLDLPCCPHCSAMLFEVESEEVWNEGVQRHDLTHPGYAAFLKWSGEQETCWPSIALAAEEYQRETGEEVSL
jgi:hypothetical protein